MEKPFIAVRYIHGADRSIFADLERYGYEVKILTGPYASIGDPNTQDFFDLLTANLPFELVKDLLKEAAQSSILFVGKELYDLWKKANAQRKPSASVAVRTTRIRIGAKLPDQTFVGLTLTSDMSESEAKAEINEFYDRLNKQIGKEE